MKTVDHLKEVFRHIAGNFFLRGSIARGEETFKDIDIVIYTHPSQHVHENDLPQVFNGVHFSYVEFRFEEVDEYFTTRLRTANDLFESLPLKIKDQDILTIFARKKREFIEACVPYYLLYLLFEDRLNSQYYKNLLPINDYSYFKSYPGSKRSLLRYFWSAHCLAGDFDVEDYRISMARYEQTKLLPPSFLSVYESLSEQISGGIDSSFYEIAKAMIAWREKELAPIIEQFVVQKVDLRYQESLSALADPNILPTTIKNIYSFINSLKPCASWTLLFGISSHPHTPKEILREIFKNCSGKGTYKDIIRNLVRNPSFDMELLNRVDYTNDRVVARYRYERTKIHDN